MEESFDNHWEKHTRAPHDSTIYLEHKYQLVSKLYFQTTEVKFIHVHNFNVEYNFFNDYANMTMCLCTSNTAI